MAARKTNGGMVKPVGPKKAKVKKIPKRDVTQTMGANSNTRRLLKRMGYSAD